MTVMNTEQTIGNLCGIQPELYLSTGSYSLPPVPMMDPGYFLPAHWPAPRIMTRDRVVLAVSICLDDKWYYPGQWRLMKNWHSFSSLTPNSDAALAYLIPLKKWYAEVERRELSGGITITPWTGLINKKRL